MKSRVEFDDQIADLATGLDPFLGQKDPHRPAVVVVLPSFDESAALHAFEGPGKARRLHAHAWPELSARRAFAFDAQQCVADAHADAVGFSEAGVESGQFGVKGDDSANYNATDELQRYLNEDSKKHKKDTTEHVFSTPQPSNNMKNLQVFNLLARS